MAALVCGSLAYDSIMVFEDYFKNHILPDKVHMISVSFLVPEMRKAYGGCAGNICYNLKLLGSEPYPMAAVGEDFGPYRQRLDDLGISRRYVLELSDQFTAQAFITTDLDDNQITAFHPGAMGQSHRNHVRDAEGIDIGPSNVELGQPAPVGETEDAPTRTLSTESELIEVRDQLLEAFELIGISTRLGAEIDTRGLVISIATDDVLFASGSPELAPDAAELIGAITPVLRDFDNEIRIEGHTDTVPLDDNGYTNWNLSTDRALAVLGLLASDPEIDPKRLSATGYGEFRPITSNATEAGKQQNRRVELVIAAATPPEMQETDNE